MLQPHHESMIQVKWRKGETMSRIEVRQGRARNQGHALKIGSNKE